MNYSNKRIGIYCSRNSFFFSSGTYKARSKQSGGYRISFDFGEFLASLIGKRRSQRYRFQRMAREGGYSSVMLFHLVSPAIFSSFTAYVEQGMIHGLLAPRRRRKGMKQWRKTSLRDDSFARHAVRYTREIKSEMQVEFLLQRFRS